MTVVNQIQYSSPSKLEITIGASRKLEEFKEEIISAITPQKLVTQLSLIFRGKDLKEDLKTLKDLGIKTGTKLILTQKTELEMQLDAQAGSFGHNEINEEQL